MASEKPERPYFEVAQVRQFAPSGETVFSYIEQLEKIIAEYVALENDDTDWCLNSCHRKLEKALAEVEKLKADIWEMQARHDHFALKLKCLSDEINSE